MLRWIHVRFTAALLFLSLDSMTKRRLRWMQCPIMDPALAESPAGWLRACERLWGTAATFPVEGGCSAKLSDRHQIPIAERTRKVQMKLATPWAPVVFSSALALIPGSSDALNIGYKTLRERRGIDVIAGLKSAELRGLGWNAKVSAEEVAFMATMLK